MTMPATSPSLSPDELSSARSVQVSDALTAGAARTQKAQLRQRTELAVLAPRVRVAEAGLVAAAQSAVAASRILGGRGQGRVDDTRCTAH
jgi:hypothetical protein